MRRRWLNPVGTALLIGVLSACGSTQPAQAPVADTPVAVATEAPTASTDMAHGQSGDSNHGAMTSDAPYDAQFIDSMIIHHQGAIDMAEQALTEAERPEIRQLAEAIITAQKTEIAQMGEWRAAWFPDLAETPGMGMDMGTMMVAEDANKPFDQRFIEAMIPHHEGAIAMAKDAQQKAQKAEITQLAGTIISAQEAEIAQMRQWLKDWYSVQ